MYLKVLPKQKIFKQIEKNTKRYKRIIDKLKIEKTIISNCSHLYIYPLEYLHEGDYNKSLKEVSELVSLDV